MQPLTATRHQRPKPRDPAPSRLGFRFQRLLLTPGFRATVRIGVPIMLIAVLTTNWYSKPVNRDMLSAKIAEAKTSLQQRPAFMVGAMSITGADAGLTAEVAALLPVQFPVSSFDLDLEAMRKTVEAHDAVKTAALRVGQGGALEVRVTPCVPVALWREAGVLHLIDADGVSSGTIVARADRADLPLIAGDGAEDNIHEALILFARMGPLLPRMRGLVRMGERRWDIVLDRNQRILLPGADAVAALDRVIALNDAQDMLERDVLVVDMRNASRPTLQMNTQAAAALRRVNHTEAEN